jgi:hypothetical protein
MAESVATVTAADEPSPDELGIWEFTYTLPVAPSSSKQLLMYADFVLGLCPPFFTVTKTRGRMAIAIPGFP